MKKRIICLVIALAMVIAMVPVAFATNSTEGLTNFKKVNQYTEGLFPDVRKGDWFETNVKAAYEFGLMQGNANGTFAPNGNITVIQTIVTACRIHSIYYNGSANFVQGNPWYKVYVDYAVANGIIKAGEYPNLNANATRAQFAVILTAAVPESVLNPINNITVGSIYDLPAHTEYAEAAYLLYNAGVLTGSDQYGTFKADTAIKRSEAAAIATRVVDTTLRKTFSPVLYNPNPPTAIDIYCYGASRHTLTDITGKVLEEYEWKKYVPGQKDTFVANLMPASAWSDIDWNSSNPEVASVNQYGELEVHKPGETTITATTYNGISDQFKVVVADPGEQLQYALTADGKGYEIIGCNSAAYTAHIPATYNGLPVVSIKGGAFMECSQLRYFTVDENQTVFYEEGGVIFADLPEKTLVCFPPRYDAANYYYVPDGTVTIAPYGFAGFTAYALSSITLPESLTTLSDYAFAGIKTGPGIYVTDSLVNIGDHILQGQTANVPFYGNWSSAMGQFAQKNQIPFAGVVNYDPGENTTKEKVPQATPADGGSAASSLPVKVFSELDYVPYGRQVNTDYDLSDYQKDFLGEVYMELAGQWWAIVPDEDGKPSMDMPLQTGLYGVGYTATETVLRSYDRYGNLLATQQVNGNFAFCFPGAYNLGVVGGSGTTLSMIPYEPVYLVSGGNYPLQADEWYTTEKGSAYQFFIQQYPSGSMGQNMPSYLNVFVAGNYGYGSGETKGGYQIGFVELYDTSRINELTVSVVFDGQICVVDNDEMICLVNSSFEGSTTFGTRVLDMWHKVKRAMVGEYFPSELAVQKIYIFADGSWPSAAGDSVFLNEGIVRGDDDLTLAHEFVHAVDENVPANLSVAPSAWWEGRAEYISNKLFGMGDTIYTGYDWSYLSEEDKADFFQFYYFSTNRWTTYPVGTLFLRYLNETYGENISSEVMANLAALREWDDMQHSEANAVLFKQCVEAATEVGVFQNFVRDVIEK